MNRIVLLLRGFVPLLLVGLALLGGPTLLAWLLIGGPFGWRHVLVGLTASAALCIGGGLIFGWALGRRLRDK